MTTQIQQNWKQPQLCKSQIIILPMKHFCVDSSKSQNGFHITGLTVLECDNLDTAPNQDPIENLYN